MPRIRTVKPDFWTDKKIRAIPRDARLLFIGLFNLADDAGRYLADPEVIKGQLFVSDADLFAEDVGSLLRILHEHSLIRLYVVGDEDYMEICNFLKHQKIDKPSPSRYPPFDETSTNTPVILHEASGGDKEEDKEVEEEKDLKTLGAKDAPSEIFLKTWTDYWLKALKRANNPKKAAQKAWEARVKAGEVTEEQLAAATANYAQWWRGQRKEQQYVMQAATFYGPNGRLDEFIKKAPPPEGPYVPPGLQDKAPPFSRSEASSVMGEIAQERAGLAEVVCGVCGDKYRTRKPEGEKICTPCFQKQKEEKI